MVRDEVVEALLARVEALEASMATLMAERAEREGALSHAADMFSAEADAMRRTR